MPRSDLSIIIPAYNEQSRLEETLHDVIGYLRDRRGRRGATPRMKPDQHTDLYRISVVIPTYRRCDSVRRALRALCQQSLPATDFEVIVSIDGSEDGTREMVEAFAAPFELSWIWHPNRGRAGACNAGIEQARGEIIVILDDDMEASPGLLSGHLAAHPPGSRRAAVGVAPMLVDSSSPPLVRYYAAGFNGRQEELAQPGRQLHFREAYSGNFSIPRGLLLEIGAFDPDFKVYGHEDYELSLRLHRAGVQLVFSREALAFQHYEKTFAELARDSTARGRTAVLFAAKHPEVVETLPLSKVGRGPRWRRWLRSLLLTATRVLPATPRAVVAGVEWIEKHSPARARKAYAVALDYFYWLGAFAAQQLSDVSMQAPAETGLAGDAPALAATHRAAL